MRSLPKTPTAGTDITHSVSFDPCPADDSPRMVFVKRRALGIVAVVGVASWLILGMVPAASATPVSGNDANFLYSANDANVSAGAQIDAYFGAGGAVTIPTTVVINANTYNVTSIGPSSFGGKSITSVTIPPTVTSIGLAAFDSNALTSVTLPAGLTSISFDAFEQNDLTSIEIPAGVTSLGAFAFQNNAITSITFDGPITGIGQDTFAGNDLTSVVIPATVTALSDGAFNNNPNLTSVKFLGAAPTAISAAGGADPSLGSASGLVVFFLWRFGTPQTAAGFTTPTWVGYNTVALVTLSFTMDGHGSQVGAEQLQSGDTPAQPTDPTTAGLSFSGWFTDATLTTKYNFATAQTSDTTAFAGWNALATTGVSISPFAIPGAVGVLVLGTALILFARRRRTS